MKPPEKGGPCCEHGPNSITLPLPHSYQQCSHSAKKIERMPAGHVHFAAERCVNCRRLLRWLPRPETIARRKVNGFRLAKLSMCERLNSWERGFIRDLTQRRKLAATTRISTSSSKIPRGQTVEP